jgi:putative oxidoreductase
MFHQLTRWHRTLVHGLDRLQPVLLLALRLYWGYQFFITGRGKLLNIERTAGFFESIDIPLPLLNAYAAGMTECIGGLLLLAGLASRLASIPLIATMLVAYATAHREQLMSLFTNPDAFVTAPPFLFLLASVIVLVFGPGPLSLDRVLAPVIARRFSTPTAAAPTTTTFATAASR